ncbi:LOW QUALITY PROTEIN: cubilin-like, partial [Palaemon carinicauda]|uniref:LOW QUALITY PROTEIN: cubilin-like n=1 Tax=Palaemon carinicauda TaxID=392227 RepID=UPI0035B651FB
LQVWSVRGQLQSLNNTDLGYLVQNLSRVAQTVASGTWISTSIGGLNRSVSSNTNEVGRLRSEVTQMRTILDPLAVNVSRLNSLASLATPDGAQRIQNLLTRLDQLQQSSTTDLQRIQELSDTIVPQIRQTIADVQDQISGLPDLEDRIAALEIQVNTSQSLGGGGSLSPSFRRNFRRVKRNLRQLKTDLLINECASGPCQHGGTCIDGFKRYTCICPKGWEGESCSDDFNECEEYVGTDMGCQNGATCTNTDGGYRCSCTSGWFGVRCTERNTNCSSGSGLGLCGPHGICIPSPRGQHPFSCICDEGWKPGTTNPACVDVDECSASQPRCSHDPPVQCVNFPGGFSCGPCPQGYSGNGFYCNDINECLFNNGGCSPFSRCENIRGSRRCGPCAAGYTGDGVTCMTLPNPCLNNPCHPLARCSYNPQMSSTYYQCICPPGYQGSGMGFNGCVPSGTGGGASGGGQVQPVNMCLNQPCRNGGTCTQYPGSYTYNCLCPPGYAGQNCEIDVDECASQPCLNGGSCTQGLNSFTCSCTAAYTGDRCQTENEQCGGLLTGTEGQVVYPGVQGQTYNHNVSCAYVISVPRDKVINITFHSFHLEGGTCLFDWLQIHDGRSSSSQLLGRFCGTTLPGNNGTILSTHNQLYIWFRSDHSRAGYGFNFTWNATDPVCGQDISRQEYGSINSPGYPGRYPINRDCYYTIRVRPGKRIRFHFATLQIEHHPNCSFDFLEVRDGLTETGHSIGKFCSTQAPAPLTTSGSEAFIHFHSDYSATDTGFHISFSAEPGIPGCGGLLTNDMGEFSPPTLSDQYEHNLHCEWQIRVPQGETVSLTFSEFHLERHHACRWDYVEIRDGGSPDSPLIRRACGLDIPDPVTSSGNQLFVIFHSDYSVSRPGFRAVYQVACGGEYSGDTGLIRTPYHPLHYPHNRECIYIINQPVGKAILLNFTDFDIERPSYWRGCIFDYVEVRDGGRATSPLLGRFCGPESHRPDPVISTLNVMWLKFVTDSSVSNHGFIANYTTIDTICGGVLRATSGHITSPNSPDRYPHNTDCRWVLDLPPGFVIQISWQTFSLESHYNCDYDYVEIFDNSSIAGNGGQMGDRYCGDTVPPIMTSSDNLVTIHFHSDHSANHDGFAAIYHGLNASRMCGGHYHTSSGVISSPNYPHNYPNSRTCEWTITVGRGRQIRLIFNEVEIEESENCYFDALEIRNGGTATSPLLTSICSKNKTVPEMFSHHHQLYIKFRTDNSANERGFQISWDSATTGCGGTLTTVTGEIISPGYPQQYHDLQDCTWIIRVGQGSKVMLHFIDILEENSGCYFDFVEVRDGSSFIAPSLGRFCSTSHGFISINSTSNTLWLRFRSDHSQTGRGFKAQYVTGCNNVLKGHRGVIVTPNYPDPYPHQRNCTWTIMAPRGNSINASFSDFILEDHMNADNTRCLFDYVDVRARQREGPQVDTIGHYCRGRPTPPAISTGPRMDILDINFVSDFSVAANGFRLEWIVNGCGGELTKFSGIFTSPNYPDPYPVNTDCEWFITTAPGTRIKLTVHDFELETADDCIYDKLRIYGGQNEQAPPLTSLCHKKRIPLYYETQGNNAYLSFHSDQTVRGKGFNMSYTTLPGGCGGNFTSPKGSIHSPNYPAHYDANSDCVWVITVDQNHIVELTFVDFDVEPDTNCSYDAVSVYDGDSTDALEILQHCGASLPSPATLKSSGNSLTVRLRADGTMGAKGFIANYTRGCGATIDVNLEASGELSSPYYPHAYIPMVNCSWHLQAPEGYRVLLHIVHLDMDTGAAIADNCTREYVSIKDGPTNNSPEIGRYCGHRAPRSITSTSHALTVNIFKDYGFGVGFRATYSVLTSTCGGELTSLSGELATPGYPQPYPVSVDCIWTISAGPGNRLQLNFEDFDIEESEGCNLDYLEIHQQDPTGPLLLHNCSSSSVASVTTHDKMWIKFKSDEANVGARGFLASYNIVFGDEIFGESGEIVSPLYSHLFRSSEDILWTISVPWGKYVSIRVEEMMIERSPMNDDCYSTLVIYDGRISPRTSPTLATFCGNQPPDNRIVSTANVVTVRFQTLNFFKGSRFRLSYVAVDERGSSGVTQIGSNNCTFFIRLNGSETIRNPGYPGYANNLDCEWIIEADPHNSIFVYVTYDLEESYSCYYDRLMIYDGLEGTQNWNLTRTLCRRDQVRQSHFTSSGRFLRIKFITDSSQTQTGFSAMIRTECGGYLRGTEGQISTPLYPQNYPSYLICNWVIKVGLGKTIKLEFDEFKVANTTPLCGGDYLLMRNGESRSSPYLGVGRYCGTSIPEIPESNSNAIRLKFVSDALLTDKGFKLRYYEESAACGGLHHITSELPKLTISSPNYPHPPNPHTECSWTVMAPSGKSIAFHVMEIDMLAYDDTCQAAFVEVRDGGTMLSPLLAKSCGNTPPSTQHATGNVLFVRYYNNVTTPHAGFKAELTIDTCGGTYEAAEPGIITSPNYPAPYAADVNCTWRIVAPTGHYLTLTFLDIDIHNAGDNCSLPEGRVVVREKNSTGDILGTVCGRGVEVAPIETGSNIAYVTFRGAHNPFGFTGFRFMYNKSFEECGGDLVGPTGEFTSPGYPHGYAHRRICSWNIKVPEGRRVRLDFVDVDMPVTRLRFSNFFYSGCSAHAFVLNGPRSGPMMIGGYICGSDAQGRTFNSSMNEITVLFRSTQGSFGRGFKARWSSDEPSACGGILTSTSGRISSSQENSAGYNHSIYCVWKISNPNPANSSFYVQVDDLHLEDHCLDHVLVQGVTAESEVITIQKVCNDYSRDIIVVPYPVLQIAFRTDRSVSRTGWNLTYGLSPCGGILRGPQDIIHSPNYPRNYPDNTHCAWIMNYDEGSQIDLEFTNFNLENSIHHDYVTLHNGPRISSPVIGRYTGTKEAGHVARSMTNALMLEFHSDASGNERGFRAVSSVHERGCGGVFHGITGNITSPGFPSNYESNLECIWEVDVQYGYHAVFTFVERFDLETGNPCQNDYVQFFHTGQTEPDHAIEWVEDQKLCGKQMPPPVPSMGIRTRLLFRTNDQNQGQGFKVSWNLICGNNYTANYGYVTSPGYPGNYPNFADCVYNIIASPESFVKLEFISFELERGRSCEYDWVLISETQSRNRWSPPRSWGKYCGSVLPEAFTARGSVSIHFKSDYSLRRNGFSLNYTIEECGGNITSPGIIQLPTMPIYHNSMYCVWDIKTPDGKVPHFKFERLVLEGGRNCQYDSVSIYNGLVEDDSKLISRFCGNHTDALPIQVGKERNTRVVFRSDETVAMEGLKIAVEFTYACGGNINISRSGATETIRSLDADNDGNYEPLLNCEWLVEGLDDHVIQLNFTRLSLEPKGENDTVACPYDFVQIYDGPSSSSELIGTFCNSSSIPTIASSSNVMFIRFRSDSANQMPGFTAKVSNLPHPCGGSSLVATNQGQVLESPGYPNQYPVSIRCRWVIRAPEASQNIHLSVDDMQLEMSPRCSRDQLYISEYSASTTAALPINFGTEENNRYPVDVGGRRAYFTYGNALSHGYCGNTIPHHLQSSTNGVLIQFRSDETTTAPGFRLHYSIGSCNRTFNGTSGIITSMGREISCFSQIMAPQGKYVNVYFSSMYVRSRGGACGNNVLKLYDGPEASGEPVVAVCGYRLPNPVFSTGNSLYLALTSSTYSRFKLTYTTSDQPGGCGSAMYVDYPGRISSPGYPGPAPSGLDCMFTISVAPNKHVAVRAFYIDFGTQETCNGTYLEMYDIYSNGQSVLFNTVCGFEELASHLAPSYRIALRFVTSNATQTGQGWMLGLAPATPHEETVFDEPPNEEMGSTVSPGQ